LRPFTRTSFHHQPEAQHPKSSAIHKLPADYPIFCKSAKLDEIKVHENVLTPGRYVGAADVENDDVPFPERFDALRAKLEDQFAETDKLTRAIRSALRQLG
jgi:type I restriction enzyme M protein